MTTRQILDADGRTTATLECPQVLTAWERVYRVLRDAFPPERYHRGVGLRSFSQSGAGVTARLSDGRSVSGDVMIGADGLRSSVRQQCLPEVAPFYAGYVAWRALLAEAAIPEAIHRELFMLMTFCLPPGEQCLGYPVTGPDQWIAARTPTLQRRLVPSAGETTELPRLLTDKSGLPTRSRYRHR